MKHSIITLAGLIVFGSAHASIIIPDAGKAISATTTLPSVKPDLIKDCATASPDSKASCVVYTTTGIALSISSVALLKEEVKQVEPDAYAFLAGEDMTLALSEVLENARLESEELALLSDQELVSSLLGFLN